VSLKRNTLYNLVGSIAPMFIGMATVPLYLHKVGDARYGVLALVWLFLGYFGLFDPGVTRAAVFHIARLGNVGQEKGRESVFWTALVINLSFGVIGGLILYFIARPVFMSTFKMPEEMRAEVMASLPWLAASVPVSIVAGVLGGAMEARECFGLLNSIGIFNAVLSQIVPLAVAYLHGPDLRWLIPAVLITRAVGAIPTCIALIRVLPIGRGGRFDPSRVKPLFTYGGWITITNLLNPILSTMDRMLIGSLLSVQAVTFYTVPFNLVTRASVIPGAVASSLFPKLSRGRREEGAELASSAVTALAAVMTPIIILGIAALPIFMHFWVGATFAQHAASVGIVLLIGVWINGLAYIPSGHLQAIERPDIVAKFHAIELIPFLAVLWLGLHFFGLIGAAWAWTLRVAVDGFLLFMYAGQLPGWRRIIPGGILVLISSMFAPTSILSIRTGLEFGLFAVAVVWSWNVSPMIRLSVQRLRGSKPLAEVA
jgi:O-antigen/teichoic acid export membrane protein